MRSAGIESKMSCEDVFSRDTGSESSGGFYPYIIQVFFHGGYSRAAGLGTQPYAK